MPTHRPPLAQTETTEGWRSWSWLGPPKRALFSAGWALLPLRAFLGLTFVFAGLQKLANPTFFQGSNPASIRSQLIGAAHHSPIHALLTPLVHVAVPIGLLIAFGELAVGLGTLLGLWSRIAAVGGIVLSAMLFLTVSFHTNPYYTGADIVFVFAWMPLILAGSGGALSLDAVLARREQTRMGAEPSVMVPIPFSAVRRACGFYDHGSCQARRGAPCAPVPCPYLIQRPTNARRLAGQELDRRTFVAKGAAAGALGVAALIGAGVVAGVGRLAGGTTGKSGLPSLGGGASGPGPTTTPPTTPNGPSPSTTTPGGTTPPGTRIGPARDVPVGGAASFQDPRSGDPSLVVQPETGTFLAFDAVCPHAGCTVQFDSTQKLFICPCHGSEFNGRTGAVEVGPAATGLGRLGVAEGPDGQLYVT